MQSERSQGLQIPPRILAKTVKSLVIGDHGLSAEEKIEQDTNHQVIAPGVLAQIDNQVSCPRAFHGHDEILEHTRGRGDAREDVVNLFRRRLSMEPFQRDGDETAMSVARLTLAFSGAPSGASAARRYASLFANRNSNCHIAYTC
jgi:hypothetical protein